MADTAAGLRSFVVAIHNENGILLLQANKPKKGEHFQLPGGRIDQADWIGPDATAATASKNGAVRELFEETAIDLRSDIGKQRLIYLKHCAQKHRFYFLLRLSDADIPSVNGETNQVRSYPLSGQQFPLYLSGEHTGFTFVKDLLVASEMVKLHSGGKSSMALRAYAASEDQSSDA